MLLCTLSKKKVKRIVIILIVCIFGEILFAYNGNQNVYGSTEKWALAQSNKYIKVKVQSATKKGLKLKVINTTKRKFFYGGAFVLKKRVKNKWKKVKFKGPIMFVKTKTLRGKSSRREKLKWKKFFGKNLSKGRYKIDYGLFYKNFRIK